MDNPFRTALFLALLLVMSGAVSAQDNARPADTHRGFWLGFGGGGGYVDGFRAAGAYVRMGGTPTSRALFGGQVTTAWREFAPGDEIAHTVVTATGYFYPFYTPTNTNNPLREIFFKAGMGVADVETNGQVSETGIGTLWGAGADLRLGNNFFVTPNVDVLVSFLEDRVVAGVLVTLGLSWH